MAQSPSFGSLAPTVVVLQWLPFVGGLGMTASDHEGIGVWMFSEEQLRLRTPSRQRGVSEEDEAHRRGLGVHLIREAGTALRLYVERQTELF